MTTRVPLSSRAALVLALVGLCSCVRWMRDPEFYADALSERLDARSEAIADCYAEVLAAADPEVVEGDLVVDFEVAKRTGEITKIAVDEARSEVPAPLRRCVIAELEGLHMDPPDARDARATFTWTFTPGSREAPPVDPFAEAQQLLLGCYQVHLHDIDRTAQGEFVIEWAFDRETGELVELEVVEDATTAPQQVVECAKAMFQQAEVAPGDLDDRNVAGRRSFTLRYEPWVATE